MQRQECRSQRAGHSDGGRLQELACQWLASHDHRSVVIAKTGSARTQHVLVSQISIRMQAEGSQF